MPGTPNREVNSDEEVINANEIPDDDESEEDMDEEVIPPVDEEAAEEESDEDESEEDDAEEEDPSESSPEGTETEEEEESEEESEETDESEETEPSKQEPAPVPGETPREKALRLEVQRLKKERREQGFQKLFVDPDGSPAAPSEKLKKLQEKYTPEEIAAMEEAVDVIAESRGYVKKSDTFQESVNGVVEDFVRDNPDYAPENDPEDVRWNRFQEILASDYNVRGKSPKELRRIFDKVHQDVTKEFGEPEVKAKPKQQAAQRQKIRSVQHGGTTKAAPKPKPKETADVDPTVRGLFKGFDDEDLA